MTRFVEQAIAKAGLLPVLAARRAGDLDTVRKTMPSWAGADLLALGAVADAVRAGDVGDVVRIHDRTPLTGAHDIVWVEPSRDVSELDFLRAVAVARIAARKGARIGVDWGTRGLELAQVALGFGASDLCGPITRKSGLPILEGERLKLKGQGMVELRSIKRQEIGALVRYAGRLPVFDDEAVTPAARSSEEVAGV